MHSVIHRLEGHARTLQQRPNTRLRLSQLAALLPLIMDKKFAIEAQSQELLAEVLALLDLFLVDDYRVENNDEST
jgi:hypothetical protein